MSAASAWVLAAALWLGCLLPASAVQRLASGAGAWTALVGAAVLLASATLTSDRRRLVVLAAGMGLVGVGLAGGRVDLAAAAVLSGLAEQAEVVDVRGVVVTEPRLTDHGAWAVVRVGSVNGRPVRERAMLRLDEDLPDVGDEVTVTARARPLGHDGFDGHLRRLHAVAALDPVDDIDIHASTAPVWRWSADLRSRVRTVAGARLDEDRAAVLTGLLTGDVRGQSAARKDQLARAGLTHLVVVSGRHVALLLGAVLAVVVLLGAGARARRLVGLGVLAGYVVLVRWQPSVLRAGVMATLVLGAGLLGRRTDARHALAMAVILLLLVDPLLAGHLGFGLSVGATAGVLVVAPWLAPRLRGPRAVRVLVAASVGAQAGAAPLLLTLDAGMSVATVPANLVAVPLAAGAQLVGLVAVLAGLVVPAVGELIALAAAPLLTGILRVAEVAAAAPALAPESLLGPRALAVAVALAAALALRRTGPGLAGALTVALVLAGVPTLRPPAGVTDLSLTALDVGQGDALLVEVPRSSRPARMLVDGGPDEGTVLRELRRRGVRALDAVLVTHPHDDHSGGLPAVLRRLPVGALLTGTVPARPGVDAASAVDLERIAGEEGVPVRRLAAGQRLSLAGSVIEVLSPPADGSLDFDPNERSVVVRVVGPHGSILLTGDVEVAGQARLLRHPERLAAAVLKVPHHGAATNADGFLRAVGATDAVVSVGAGNTHGHPHPDTLAELEGMRIHRTDEDGEVTLAVTAAGVQRRRRAAGASVHRRRGRRRRAGAPVPRRPGRRRRAGAPVPRCTAGVHARGPP